MRIALLLHQPLDSGGDMPRALALGRELGRRGHLVSVLCEAPQSNFGRSGSRIELVKGPRYWPGRVRASGLHPLSILWRWRWLRRRSFDLVHTFGVRPTVALPAYWAQREGARWVADWSDYWGWGGIAAERGALGRWTVGALDHRFERWSRLGADGVLAISTFLAALAVEWRVPRSRVQRLGGGADVERIHPLEKGEARHEFGMDSGRPMVVFSGRSQFDLQLVGEVFEALRRRRPDVQLLLLGGARAYDLGLGNAEGVLPLGFLPQDAMALAIACADVALLPLPAAPFNRARFPNRLGDYLAAARPVVTNPTGDAGRFVVEHGVGLAVPDDAGAMASALQELLDDPGRADLMGARARRAAEEQLSWQRLSRQVEAFYRLV